jgi:hypothetical protein
MLLVRAAVERAELAARLDSIDARTRLGREIAGALLGHARPGVTGWLGVAASAVRIARSQPWIVPTVVGVAVRVARSRTLRWIALAGAVVGTVWWVRRLERASEQSDAAVGGAAPVDDSQH